MADILPEEQKQLTDAEEVESMLQSKGWAVVKAKLDEKILDLQNIHNLDEENLATDLKARVVAVKTLFEWVKNDVYGFVEQARSNAKQKQDAADEVYIDRGPNK